MLRYTGANESPYCISVSGMDRDLCDERHRKSNIKTQFLIYIINKCIFYINIHKKHKQSRCFMELHGILPAGYAINIFFNFGNRYYGYENHIPAVRVTHHTHPWLRPKQGYAQHLLSPR